MENLCCIIFVNSLNSRVRSLSEGIQEFSIMSEAIDPVSLEMGGERTCSAIHFQKVQGGKVEVSNSHPFLHRLCQFCTHLFK